MRLRGSLRLCAAGTTPFTATRRDSVVRSFGALRPPQDDNVEWSVELRNAVPADVGMVGLRCVLHDPAVLADGSSPSPPLARERRLAVPSAGSGVDCDVVRGRRPHRAVALCRAVLDMVELASCRTALRAWNLYLFPRRRAFQLGTTRRIARSPQRTSRRPVGHDGHSCPRPPSGVSGAFVRDGRVEHRDGPGCVLGADCFCDRDGCGDGSDGGSRVGEKIRGGVSEISPPSARCISVDLSRRN